MLLSWAFAEGFNMQVPNPPSLGLQSPSTPNLAQSFLVQGLPTFCAEQATQSHSHNVVKDAGSGEPKPTHTTPECGVQSKVVVVVVVHAAGTGK